MIYFNRSIEGEKVDQAMAASSAGQAALVAGDTLTAGEQFRVAGERLEEHLSSITRRNEMELTRFLAATNYYKGGHYERAKRVCKDIHEFMLPAEVKPLFAEFISDVKERANSHYAKRIDTQLGQMARRSEYEGILATLQDHPYILSRGDMACIRAHCCEHLREYRTAALFLADAIKWKPEDPSIRVASATLPFSLLAQDPANLSEAWRSIEQMLDVVPNAMADAGAACIRYLQTRGAKSEDDQRRYSAEVISHFDEGWNRFQELSAKFKADFEMRELMTYASYAAVYAYQFVLGNPQQARDIRERAMRFNPTSSLHEKLVRKTIPDNGASQETESVASDGGMNLDWDVDALSSKQFGRMGSPILK